MLQKFKKYIRKKILGHQYQEYVDFNQLPFKKIDGYAHVEGQFRIINPQFISIGKGFSSLYGLRLEAFDRYGENMFTPGLTIGDNVCMNTDIHIGCINKIIIGDNVLMGSRIFITDHSHGTINTNVLDLPPIDRSLFSKGPVIIENNVWIGEGVCILPGVTIGKNSIIGANAVVTQSFPENSVIGGIPARLIKTLI